MNKTRIAAIAVATLTFGSVLAVIAPAPYPLPPIVPAVIQPVTGQEWLVNADMEGPFTSREFNEVTVAQGWDAWYCDIPYTATKCPVPLEDNPYEPYMQRPEFTPNNPLQTECLTSSYLNRVYSRCNGSHFFGFSRVINAGIQQKVTGLPLGNYQLSMFVQIWSNGQQNARGCTLRNTSNACILWMGAPYTSDIASLDDITAMTARIGYDPTCGTNAFASTVIWSREFGYIEGLYDHYGQIAAPVQVTRNCVTVFLGGRSRFANYHNNFYLDLASLRLLDAVLPGSTASPAATRTPTRTSTIPSSPTVTPIRTSTPLVPACPSPVACLPPVEITRIVEVTRVVIATQGAGPTPTRLPPINTHTAQPTAAATVLGGPSTTLRVIAVGGLRLRSGPSSTSTVLTIMPYDSFVVWRFVQSGIWMQVQFGSLVGWASETYLEETVEPKP